MNQPKQLHPRQRLTVEDVPIESIQPYARNARTHSKQQIQQIADSIDEFGFVNPILIDEDGSMIAGHGRLGAATLLGLKQVPTIRIAHLDDAQKCALRIADNKIAENAGWDTETLALELQHLLEIESDLDLTITGFETAEIDLMFESVDGSTRDPALDAVPDVGRDLPAISQPGDLWHLNSHRILCGDATQAPSFDRLMGDERAQVAFTDPPYNVPISGHVSGLGETRHREFIEGSGEMSESDYIGFLSSTFTNLTAFSVDGAVHFICMDWRHGYELMTAARATFDRHLNLCVWNKSNGGMGSLYRSKHEFVYVFKSGRSPHVNNIELGRHGRNRTNVWDYPGVNTFGNDRMEAIALHPTVKPVALVADAIMDCSDRGRIVLDCFVGSGTTIIAAEETGRRAYTMDLDPLYVDTAIRRWQRLGGSPARHAETGQTFDELAEERSGQLPHVG